MSSTDRSPQAPEDAPRRLRWLAAVAVLAIALAVIFGIALRPGASSGSAGAKDHPGPAGTTSSTGVETSKQQPEASPEPPETPTGAPQETSPSATAETPASGEPVEVEASKPAEESPAPPAPGPPAADEAQRAAEEQPVAEPVAIADTLPVSEGITARVVTLEAVQGEAQGIGEIAGPAIRFIIEIDNDMDEALPFADAVVNVFYGEEELPAVMLSGPDAAPFTEDVPARSSLSGTYVFLIPPEGRDQVAIHLNYSVTAPIVGFAGSAPKPEG